MKQISLSNGQYALVDDEDFDRLSAHGWSCNNKHTCYACRTIGPNKQTIFMHLEILPVQSGMVCDHVNGNSLDNRKINLRELTPHQNQMNRKKNRTAIYSQYKGVGLSRRGHGFRARIVVDGREFHLGTFPKELDAARAYDTAAKRYFGDFARLNLG